MFPFVTMRFDVPSVFLKGNQMRNFVDQSNQKPILIKAGINCNLMRSIHVFAIIAMPGLSLIDDFQMYMIGFNQFNYRLDTVLWEIFS